jgi:hypothetical protein
MVPPGHKKSRRRIAHAADLSANALAAFIERPQAVGFKSALSFDSALLCLFCQAVQQKPVKPL